MSAVTESAVTKKVLEEYDRAVSQFQFACKGMYAGPSMAISQLVNLFGAVDGIDTASLVTHTNSAVGIDRPRGGGNGFSPVLGSADFDIAHGAVRERMDCVQADHEQERDDARHLATSAEECSRAIDDVVHVSDSAIGELASTAIAFLEILSLIARRHPLLRVILPIISAIGSQFIEHTNSSISRTCEDRDTAIDSCYCEFERRCDEVCGRELPPEAPDVCGCDDEKKPDSVHKPGPATEPCPKPKQKPVPATAECAPAPEKCPPPADKPQPAPPAQPAPAVPTTPAPTAPPPTAPAAACIDSAPTTPAAVSTADPEPRPVEPRPVEQCPAPKPEPVQPSVPEKNPGTVPASVEECNDTPRQCECAEPRACTCYCEVIDSAELTEASRSTEPAAVNDAESECSVSYEQAHACTGALGAAGIGVALFGLGVFIAAASECLEQLGEACECPEPGPEPEPEPDCEPEPCEPEHEPEPAPCEPEKGDDGVFVPPAELAEVEQPDAPAEKLERMGLTEAAAVQAPAEPVSGQPAEPAPAEPVAAEPVAAEPVAESAAPVAEPVAETTAPEPQETNDNNQAPRARKAGQW